MQPHNGEQMLIEYRNMCAQVNYSAVTNCYYGEVIGRDYVISFQSKNKHELLEAMRFAVDRFLDSAVAQAT